MSDENKKYWYNLETGQVEQGYESPAIDRAGPFDTAEEGPVRSLVSIVAIKPPNAEEDA